MARLATVIANTIFSTWTGEEGPYTEEEMMLKFGEQDEAELPDPEMMAAKLDAAFGQYR